MTAYVVRFLNEVKWHQWVSHDISEVEGGYVVSFDGRFWTAKAEIFSGYHSEKRSKIFWNSYAKLFVVSLVNCCCLTHNCEFVLET